MGWRQQGGSRLSNGRALLLAAAVVCAFAGRVAGSSSDEYSSAPEKRLPAQGPAPYDSSAEAVRQEEGLISDRREWPREAQRGSRRLDRSSHMGEHCREPKRGHIVLKGERHSGTNFIERILRMNTWPNANEVDQGAVSKRYGWKHGYLGQSSQPFNATDDTMIVVTRDAFTWLSKMMEEAYDPLMNAKREELGFSAFIRAPYTNICHDNENDLDEDSICESSENLVQARTQKYKQWLSDDPDDATYTGSKEEFLWSRIHVRLEDIANYGTDDNSNKERQLRYLGDPLSERCVKVRRDYFRAVTHHISTQSGVNWQKKRIDHNQEKELLLEKYSKEDLKFVLLQLDLEFERKIGYDYGYVYDIILNEL